MIDPLQVVQTFYAALGAGDIESASALLAEDVVFELGGTSRFSGRHEGRERVFSIADGRVTSIREFLLDPAAFDRFVDSKS